VRPRATTSETADDAVSGFWIDHAPHFLQRDREIARDAGHHCVGVVHRHHAGRERVAVLVHHALTVADQVAAPLQPLVQIGGIFGIAP
jgi:hypothetical protein